MRIRYVISRNRAIISSSPDNFCRIGIHSRPKHRVLIGLRSGKFKCLVFCPKFLHLAICQKIKDCPCVAVVVFQNISCSILNGVSGVASLCCHVVIHISKASFKCSLSVTAILLSYRLFILYLCRFPRQFGLYLHPIATIGAGYSCRDYWLSVLTR